MITRTDLFVQGEYITSVAQIQSGRETLIAPLSAALKRPMLIGADMTSKAAQEREITIMADKALPYEVLKRVMMTCTDADYGRISLAVIQKEKQVPAGQARTG
jgi:biopolymer transport protein TolR